MRRLTSSIAIVVVCVLAHAEARQATDNPLSHIALAKTHYAARRLADADREVSQSLVLVSPEHERDQRASDALPVVADGAPYRVGGVVPEPVRRKDFAAWFSDDAVRKGAAGIVTLEFVVKPDGKVDQIRVVDSVPLLDAAAKAAAKQWRYEPPVVNGRPASVVSVAAMSFTWRTDPMPADYLDMARFYCEHRHYVHAQALLAKALMGIREEAKAFGTTPQAGPPRVSPGAVSGPRKVKDAFPIYPRQAQAVRIQGMVIVDAIIDVNGKVKGVRVLKSVPPLDQAAVDAVRQWEYSPALLGGAPVEVIMSVTVIFSLR